MEKDAEDIENVLRPIKIVTLWFGMRPYRLKKEGSLEFSRLQIVIMVISLVLFTVVYYLDTGVFVIATYQFMSGPGKVVVALLFFGRFLQVILSYLGIVLVSRSIEIVSIEIGRIDGKLKRIGLKDEIVRANSQSRKYSIKLILLLGCVCSFLYTIVVNLVLRPLVLNTILLALNISFSSVITSVVKIYFYTLLSIFRKRFEMLNGFLKSSNKNNSVGFVKEIDTANGAFKVLVTKVKEVNCLFNLPLFIYIANEYMSMMAFIYVLLHMSLFSDINVTGRLMFQTFSSFLEHPLNFILLCTTCDALCKQANNLKITLCGIKVNPYDSTARKSVIGAGLRFMQNKLSITAYNIFNIDNRFLFSAINIATMYLFLMLQIDLNAQIMIPIANKTKDRDS